MKNKILAIILIAALSLSMFAVLKFAYAATPRIELRPTSAVVNPAYGATGTFFDVEVWLVDVVNVVAWETKIYWDPAVLQRNKITFGPFFDGGTNNYTKGSMGGESVLIGQLKTDDTTVSGTGHVATLQMIFKYPGASHIWIYESKLLDQYLNNVDHTVGDSTIKTDHPAAYFTWKATEPDGTTPASPLPDHYLKDDCQEIQVYKIVWFDGSASYDVCNLAWNGTAWEHVVGYPDIQEYVWTFGDGYQSNDIRIAPVLPPFVPMSMVRLGNPDVGWPLVLFKAFEKYFDADASKSYSPGDSIVNDTKTDGKFNATQGDVLLYGPPVADGSTLKAFTIYEKHTDGYLLPYLDMFQPQFVNGFYDPFEYVYKDMQFFKDTGYCHVSVGSEVIDHVYSGYKITGYEVKLTVYDGEGDYWRSDWRYGGSAPENIVPMWRDVAVCDIWPSLPPYDVEGWSDWWSFDTTDYVIPPPSDPWWDTPLYDYDADGMGVPHGTTFREMGVWILVSAANYGSVHDWVRIKLYAITIEYAFRKVDYIAGAPPTWEDKATPYASSPSAEYLGQVTVKVNSMAGAGFTPIFFWMPTKPAFYEFFATIEIVDAVTQDQNNNNNYFLLSTLVDACDKVIISQLPNNLPAGTIGGQGSYYALFMCDLDGSGKVGPKDFFIFSRNYRTTIDIPGPYP